MTQKGWGIWLLASVLAQPQTLGPHGENLCIWKISVSCHCFSNNHSFKAIQTE